MNSLLTQKGYEIIQKISPRCKRAIKSIYFDKPPSANWIVNWHQDLTINLTDKKKLKILKIGALKINE